MINRYSVLLYGNQPEAGKLFIYYKTYIPNLLLLLLARSLSLSLSLSLLFLTHTLISRESNPGSVQW
jgi:hypothetical protein